MGDEYCKKCGQCCKNIAIEKSTQKICRDGTQGFDADFFNMLIFQSSDEKYDYYTCKFLKENLCTNPCKPVMCLEFPSNAFAIIPDDCGYYGIIFQKRESIKQKVRKLKEEIIHYNALIETTSDKAQKKQYSRIIESHNRYISKYAEYDSDDW